MRNKNQDDRTQSSCHRARKNIVILCAFLEGLQAAERTRIGPRAPAASRARPTGRERNAPETVAITSAFCNETNKI